MRTAAVVGALCAASVIAEDTVRALTFSYLTFTDGAVSTATTTYGSAPGSGSASTAAGNQAWSVWSHAPPTASSVAHPTSYVVKPSDLAYPTFSRVVGVLVVTAALS